jgi:hypothetical protein
MFAGADSHESCHNVNVTDGKGMDGPQGIVTGRDGGTGGPARKRTTSDHVRDTTSCR